MYSIIVTLTFLCTEPPSEKAASTGNELIPSYKEMMGQIQVSYYYYHNTCNNNNELFYSRPA